VGSLRRGRLRCARAGRAPAAGKPVADARPVLWSPGCSGRVPLPSLTSGASQWPPTTSAGVAPSNRFWPLPSRTLDRSPHARSRQRIMRHFRRVAHLQGLALLESPLSPGGGLDHPGARCSPGFSTSSGLSTSSPWADASIGPPLTGFPRLRPPEGVQSCWTRSGACPGCLSEYQ
jgi:hypothetical protein